MRFIARHSNKALEVQGASTADNANIVQYDDWAGSNHSLYDELRHRYGLHPLGGETILSSRLATAEEARLLGLKRPAAVLTVEQIAFDGNGRPINATRSIHHPTRYPLRLEQGQ